MGIISKTVLCGILGHSTITVGALCRSLSAKQPSIPTIQNNQDMLERQNKQASGVIGTVLKMYGQCSLNEDYFS